MKLHPMFSVKIFLFCVLSLFLLSKSALADVPANLIHWWQFNETAGSVAEDSAGDSDGVLMNGAAWVNGAVYFDGQDNYVDLPSGLDDLGGDLSISLWVYPIAPVRRWARFVDFGNGEYADNIIFAEYNPDSIVFKSHNGGDITAGNVIASSVLEEEQWQLLTGTLDTAGNVHLYKNGVLIQSGVTMPADFVTRVNSYIGKSNWSVDPYFKGFMDDVRVYNTVLTEPEIQALATEVPADIQDVTEIWVDDDYTSGGSNDGHVWLFDAFDNIYQAMREADYGDTIHVNAGIYHTTPSIALKNGVQLIGEQAETTIIDGTTDGWFFPESLFTSDRSDPNTVIENLTIRNSGNAQWQGLKGGALYTYDSDLAIRHCIFENNMADSGGAIYNDPGSSRYSKMRIENCTFINNGIRSYAQGDGGAINCLPAGGVIDHCTFTGNSVQDFGRGGALAYVEGRVSNCTFTGNKADQFEGCGGAVYSVGVSYMSSSAKLSNCQFFNNSTSGDGGAISYIHDVVSDCVFEGNTARSGGAVSEVDGMIVDCTFQQNTAMFGGGLSDSYGTVLNCTFIANNAEYQGGGISNIYSSLIVDGCRFIENTAELFGGGGVFNSGDYMVIRNCQFVSNAVVDYEEAIWPSGSGGGMYISARHNMVVENCLFNNNSASRYGGGVIVECHCDPTIKNCTLVNNFTGENGGSVFIDYGSEAIISSSILWGNSAGVLGHEIVSGLGVTVRNCDVAGSGGSASWDDTLGIDGGGNMDTDPLFSDDPNNWHLKSQAGRYNPVTMQWEVDSVTSPCIDGGDPVLPIGLEPFANGGVRNMGIYGGTPEASKSYFGTEPCDVIVAGDINGDCVIDLQDLSFIALHWLVDNRSE